MNNAVPKRFFIIFTISGFAGLIYESIWSHYLKLFLGHAAYAQTLVLAIFMGGMAVGAWLCSRYALRWRNLLLLYAVVEAFVGIFALVFHDVFQQALQFAYDTMIPSLGSPFLVDFFKWSLAALLIFPQSVLLGMTFPLMSAGLIRRYPALMGRSIAMLYFTNSLGAVLGVLTSGFLLIGLVGLPGTIQVAGAMNILLAVTVWWLTRSPEFSQIPTKAKANPQTESNKAWFYMLLGIALLTGMASFMYEIAWIRMLSLVLGSSTHAFELMLSAFILGLALGGFWIKSRLDKIKNTELFLAKIQIIMGLLALSTLPLYNASFEWMQWIVSTLDKSDSGFAVFNISSHLIALIIMLPATLCAGMTLPLITYTLMKKEYGEKSIGAVYASNTVGAILGVILAIHIGLPLLGLKGLLLAGAAVDVCVGIYLLSRLRTMQITRQIASWSALGISTLVLSYFFLNLDLYKMGSGVYRLGNLLEASKTEILYHQDGKAATIDLHRFNNEYVTIRANGKADAAINMKGGVPSSDEPTMVLAAAIPLAYNPEAKQAAVIGMGSGLSSQTLLSSPNIERVDTIEIEPAMVEAAQGFRPRVELVYSDPRSHIYIDDAKTYFSSHNKQYDIILSEPSNPWVSGTASLFTQEFYKLLPRYLTPEGILAQWIQLYELNEELVASVVKALTPYFEDYVIYAANERDMLIIARVEGQFENPSDAIFQLHPLKEELEIIYVNSLSDINIRRIGSKQSLNSLFSSYKIAANSDYYPVLDLGAAKTRYLQQDAGSLVALSYADLPVIEILENKLAHNSEVYAKLNYDAALTTAKSEFMRMANKIADQFISPQPILNNQSRNSLGSILDYADQLRTNLTNCQSVATQQWIDDWLNFAEETLSFLDRTKMENIWNIVTSSDCYQSLEKDKKEWIQMLMATSQRQPEVMATTASQLLNNNELSQRQRGYLLATAMLGHIAQNNGAKAKSLWNQYKQQVDIAYDNELVYDLLLATSEQF